MSFKDYDYERPDQVEIERNFTILLGKLALSSSFDEQKKIIEDISAIRKSFMSMACIAWIRHTIDTTIEFYKNEVNFYHEFLPILKKYETDFYQSLIKSPVREDLEKAYGAQLFCLAELEIKCFRSEIINDLQQENQLTAQYVQLIGSARLPFQGIDYTLSQLSPFMGHSDRKVRKEAVSLHASFFAEHQQELDTIFDQLVQVRTTMAQKLGFKDFVELGYYRMKRSDYDRKMVESFREQVKEFIVPIATQLRNRQSERLGLNQLLFHDESFEFPTGNATPKGDANWIVQNAAGMYDELSSETSEFFHFMTENQLLDVESKSGKASGGYCSYVSDHQAPFIFANFNGTVADIKVLTHEAGHAFQKYLSRHFTVPEYGGPRSESAEIHSMSMEFFTYPWMERFFEEDAEKYRFIHLSETILFLPYGAAVDEFQHIVYENPYLSPSERHTVWRELERKYLPHRTYEDNDYLENGGFWQRQTHIYNYPFYYIDYALARICAFQFWKQMKENPIEAWQNYLALCQQGGSQSFLELLEVAKLKSPFESGCVESVIQVIENYLNSVDDKNF